MPVAKGTKNRLELYPILGVKLDNFEPNYKVVLDTEPKIEDNFRH